MIHHLENKKKRREKQDRVLELGAVALGAAVSGRREVRGGMQKAGQEGKRPEACFQQLGRGVGHGQGGTTGQAGHRRADGQGGIGRVGQKSLAI
jgi:hypothetical protein